jgi:hypothetical protein
MNNDGMAKIAMLKDSTRCLIYGLLGFLPVVGLPCAVAALWLSHRARVREKMYWNAAKPYRLWGVFFAIIAIFSVGLCVIFAIINAIDPGIWYSAN